MAASDYLEDKIRRHLFGTASWTKPAALYIAMFTISPADAGGGTEVVGASYARVRRDPGDANWAFPDAIGGEANNVADIIFPTPLENWGTVVAIGIFDAAVAGNLQTYGNLTQPKTVNNGDPAPKFPVGTLKNVFA